MAKIQVTKSLALIVAGNTNSNELVFNAVAIDAPVQKAWVKVTVGTIKFRVGGDITGAEADVPSFTVGESFPVTIYNGSRNLFFKAASGSDAFIISI